MALDNLVPIIVIAEDCLDPPSLISWPLVPEYIPIPEPVKFILTPSFIKRSARSAPVAIVESVILEFAIIPVVSNVIVSVDELVTAIGNLANVIEVKVFVLSELIIAFFVLLVMLVESKPIANLNGPSLDTKWIPSTPEIELVLMLSLELASVIPGFKVIVITEPVLLVAEVFLLTLHFIFEVRAGVVIPSAACRLKSVRITLFPPKLPLVSAILYFLILKFW